MADEYYQQSSQTRQMPKHAQQPQQYQQQSYQQPQYQQPQYQQYPPRQISLQEQPTSTGGWVLTLFLMCIPIVNIILIFVWAFGSSTESSKKNWARANLIWILIGIIVSIVGIVVATVMGIDLTKYMQ